MDFDLIGNTLNEIFETKSEYMGRNNQTRYLEFIAVVESITPENNSNWTKNFPSGSYFSISKSSFGEKLTLVISISDRDYDNYFIFLHPEIIKNDLGIIQGIKKELKN